MSCQSARAQVKRDGGQTNQPCRDAERVRCRRRTRPAALAYPFTRSSLTPCTHPLPSLSPRDHRHSVNLGFELCKTDLLEHVLSSGQLIEDEARRWARQLASAVSHLHACDIVHLDVKLENMFIDQSDRLKLGDLGLASVAPAGTLTSKLCGSGVYAAPEVLLSKDFGEYDGRAADIWSAGVCIFVMIRGRFPFHLGHPTSLFSAYREAVQIATASGTVPMRKPLVLGSKQQRDALSPSLLAMLDGCLSLTPEDRPSAASLVACQWLQEGVDEAAAEVETLVEAICVDVGEAEVPASPSPKSVEDSNEDTLESTASVTTSEEGASEEGGEAYATPKTSPQLAPRKLESPACEKITLQFKTAKLLRSNLSLPPKVTISAWDSDVSASSPGSMRRERQGAVMRSVPYKRKTRMSWLAQSH